MDIHFLLKEMQKSMSLNYEDRAVVFDKYKNRLKQFLASNPENIEASCLLAMVLCELREHTDQSLKILEECYERNRNTFSDDDYALWATNISYFLLEECAKEEEPRAVELLQSSILRHSKFPNTYYALGKYYFKYKNFKQASQYFNTAFSISQKRLYLYSEAISLLADSRMDDGIKKLEALYVYPFKDEELDAKIALALGRELALKGNTKRANQIAQVLLNTFYKEFDIEIDEMADFLYILKDYKACVELYDKCNFFEDANWLKKYFYSLKQLERHPEASKKLQAISEKINQDIESEHDNPSYFENDEEYESYILSEKKRLEDIQKCYNDVFNENIEPNSNTYYDIYYVCYYINCPRHHDAI